MDRLIYLSHPEVVIDPAVNVPDWGLNDIGRARTKLLVGSAVLARVTRIVASTERKAIETAEILGRGLGLVPDRRDDMGENDRSATGFLREAEFQSTADAFFAAPDRSVRGWERAVDAQARICAAARREVAHHAGPGDLLLVGHGAVGTLLWCDRAGLPIDRRHDQPRGGCLWWAPLNAGPPDAPWQTIEDVLQKDD